MLIYIVAITIVIVLCLYKMGDHMNYDYNFVKNTAAQQAVQAAANAQRKADKAKRTLTTVTNTVVNGGNGNIQSAASKMVVAQRKAREATEKAAAALAAANQGSSGSGPIRRGKFSGSSGGASGGGPTMGGVGPDGKAWGSVVRQEGQPNAGGTAVWDVSQGKFIKNKDYVPPNQTFSDTNNKNTQRWQGQPNSNDTAKWNTRLGQFVRNDMKVMPDGSVRKLKEGEFNSNNTSRWTWNAYGTGENKWVPKNNYDKSWGSGGSGGSGSIPNYMTRNQYGQIVPRQEGSLNRFQDAVWTRNKPDGTSGFVPIANYKGPAGAKLNAAGTAYYDQTTNDWKSLPGTISSDGTKVNVGGDQWVNAQFNSNGRYYVNPLTNKYAPIAGALNKDQTKVYNGRTWESATLASDGQSYYNPVTNAYAPVNFNGQDSAGRPYIFNLAANEWQPVPP